MIGGVVHGTLTNGLWIDVPVHQQVAAGRQDQRVEDVGNHEDRIQHDRQAEEDRLVDLEDLRRQRQAADLPEAGSLEFHSTSASAIVAPVPPTFTNVVKKPYAVTYGSGCPAVIAATLAGEVLQEDRRHDRVHGVVAIDPDRPEQRDQKAYTRMPGSVFSANTSGAERGLHERR